MRSGRVRWGQVRSARARFGWAGRGRVRFGEARSGLGVSRGCTEVRLLGGLES